LRCRKENGQSVCTLKTPEGAQGRGEYEILCDDIQTALPELCKLSDLPELMTLTAQGVLPVCGARFTRIAKTLVLEDCTVELALDAGVLFGGGREEALCEVEVELKSGIREGAYAYAMALAGTFGLEREFTSKFRRALALTEGV
jgi:inorganic triphosphatase YgiF